MELSIQRLRICDPLRDEFTLRTSLQSSVQFVVVRSEGGMLEQCNFTTLVWTSPLLVVLQAGVVHLAIRAGTVKTVSDVGHSGQTDNRTAPAATQLSAIGTFYYFIGTEPAPCARNSSFLNNFHSNAKSLFIFKWFGSNG